MQSKKHVVIVTTWFPPLQSVAVNRMLAFVKYLDKSKYNISVITLKSEVADELENMHDANVYRLENKQWFKLPTFNAKDSSIFHKIKVVKKLFVLKVIGDEYGSWTKQAAKELHKLNLNSPIDIILSSFAPAAPHIAVAQFLKENPNVKWIADMRDEMSLNNELSEKTSKKLRKVEISVNQLASAITTVSHPIVNYFKAIMPNVKYVDEIRNGFDHELEIKDHKFKDVFTIVYTGNFYGDRKPDTFFKALLNIRKELPTNWTVQFVGSPKNFWIPSELKNNVEFIPRVPQDESIRYMANADATLIVHPAQERKGIFTGKLFDYASVKRPIIAIIDKSDVAADLIRDLNIGFVADFDDIKAIEIAILNVVDLWKRKENMQMNEKGIVNLHRKFQVEKLEVLIDKILEDNV